MASTLTNTADTFSRPPRDSNNLVSSYPHVHTGFEQNSLILKILSCRACRVILGSSTLPPPPPHPQPEMESETRNLCHHLLELRFLVLPVRCRAKGSNLEGFQDFCLRVQGLGFRVQGSGFRVQGSGFRVQGSGFRVQGSGFDASMMVRFEGLGFGILGLGFRV